LLVDLGVLAFPSGPIGTKLSSADQSENPNPIKYDPRDPGLP